MLSITAFTNALEMKEVRELQKEEFLKVATNNLDKEFDAEIVPAFERAIRKVVPDYKPLSEQEKQQRKELYELATTSVGPAMYDLVTSLNNVPELDDLDRSLQSIFFGIGNTEKDIEQKKEMARVLREGTAEERHDLFLETMDRMADFPMEEFRAAGPADRLRNLSRYMPMLQLGLEGENILKLFDDTNCGITEEERKQFTTMFAELNAAGMEMTQTLEMMLNPYYASVDCTKLPLGAEDIDALEEKAFEEGVPRDHVIHQFRESAERVVANQLTPYRIKVSDTFKAAGLATDMKEIYLCTEKGKILSKEETNRKDLQWIREGKTVYYTSSKDANKEVMAFRDLAGNGILTRVPPEVKKPNGFVSFFDKINRALGGKGFQSVNKYNEYTRQIAALTEEVRHKSINDEYKDTAKKVHEDAEARRQQKAAAKVQVRQNTVEEKTVAQQKNIEINIAVNEEPEVIDIPIEPDFSEISKKSELSQEIVDDTAPKPVENQPKPVEKPKTVEEQKNNTVYSGGDEEPDEPSVSAKDERNSEQHEADRERAISYVYNDIDFEKTGNIAAKTMDEDLWRSEHKELLESVREEAQKRYDEHAKMLVEQPKLPTVNEQPAEKKELTQEEIDADNRERAFDIVYSRIKAEAEGRELKRSFEEEDWCADHKDLLDSVRAEAQKKYENDARAATVNQAIKRIDQEAAERSNLLRQGNNLAVQCYKQSGNMTVEQKKWAEENPAAARDGFENLKRSYLATRKAPYTANQQKSIQFFDSKINAYKQAAAAKNDPVELAHQNRAGATEADNNKSIEIVNSLFRNGKQSPEEAKWTAAHPEAVRDALALAKHDYTMRFDGQPHNNKYYLDLVNIDNLTKDVTAKINEKSRQNPQSKTTEQKTNTALKAMI